jgi:hypothetical protein
LATAQSVKIVPRMAGSVTAGKSRAMAEGPQMPTAIYLPHAAWHHLRRLSGSFGIGIIELDLEDPDSSTILVPARRRDPMDWDALNKLAMNKDVQALLKRIKKDLQTKEIRREDFDNIPGPEELVASIRRANV